MLGSFVRWLATWFPPAAAPQVEARADAVEVDNAPPTPWDHLPRVKQISRVGPAYASEAPAGSFLPSLPSVRADSFSNPTTSIGYLGRDRHLDSRPDTLRSKLTSSDIRALMRSNGLARRIVEFMPQMALRRGFSFECGDEGDRLWEIARDTEFRARFVEAWTLGRQYGGALLIPMLDEQPDSLYARNPDAQLREPLDLERVRAVWGWMVLERDEFDADTWDHDPKSPNQRRVRTWNLYPLTYGAGGRTALTIHASRAIYFPGSPVSPRERLENNGTDDSVLESLFDQIRNRTVGSQALATLMHAFSTRIMKIQGLAGKSVSDQEALLTSRLQSFAKSLSVLNVGIMADGDSMEILTQSVAGMADLMEVFAVDLRSASGIPGTVLDGDSPGGLNADGESAQANLRQLIEMAQEWIAKPRLIQAGKIMAAAVGVDPYEVDVEFAPLDSPTAKQTADLRKTNAETDAIYIDRGVISPDHVARSRFGEDGYRDNLLPIDEDDMGERETEYDPEAEPGDLMEDEPTEEVPRMDSDDVPPPPREARDAAGRALLWKARHGVKGRPGWEAAARRLEAGHPTVADLRELAAASQLRTDSAPSDPLRPWASPRHVAWLAAGGHAGTVWARNVAASMQRHDADGDSLILFFEVAGVGIDAKIEGARSIATAELGQVLQPTGYAPHVTAAWFGDVSDDVAQRVAERLRADLPVTRPAMTVEVESMGGFDAGADGRTPIVLHLEWDEQIRAVRRALESTIEAMEAASGSRVATPSEHWLSPHITVGYAEGHIGWDARRRLMGAVGRMVFPVTRLVLAHGRVELASWAVGERPVAQP